MPASVIDIALHSGQISSINVQSSGSRLTSIYEVLNRIKGVLKHNASEVIRICVPALGSPMWGELKQEVSQILSSSPLES